MEEDGNPATSLPPPPSSSSSQAFKIPQTSEMESILHYADEDSSSLWDWCDLVNFAADDADLNAPAISSPEKTPQSPEIDHHVRKRDPRLSCSNFLAGRIPCACPELDQKADEELGTPLKKRKKTKISRCQVTGCDADIGELKGYHRRHRVCLRCANAAVVLLDGLTKRYCQQCGRFHHLSDFDEDKRSCRRKLERHNNRRRRKLNDSASSSKKQTEVDRPIDGIIYDTGLERDKTCFFADVSGREIPLGSEDANISKIVSFPNSENTHSSMVSSFSDPQVEGGNVSSKSTISSLYYNQSAYTSAYPTGRMSFKLYDWNPAEFPRSLRHQIFQWLASMPVELEGYIRPGCTILTAFISMARDSWDKVNEDVVSSLKDLLVTPGGALYGKGMYLVHMNGLNLHVSTDGNHFLTTKSSLLAPQLHCVYPICFEAGKPIEFIVGGSNLCHTNARFLVSFAGKYLPNTNRFLAKGSRRGAGYAQEHQLYKILISGTDPKVFGPAFVEVENELGLSAFLPILIGDGEVCSEMVKLQERLGFWSGSSRGASWPLDRYPSMLSLSRTVSDLVLDVAWFIRYPLTPFSQNIASSNITRFSHLIRFLLHSGCVQTVERARYRPVPGRYRLENGSCSPVQKNKEEVVISVEERRRVGYGNGGGRWGGLRSMVVVAASLVALCFVMCVVILRPDPVGYLTHILPNCITTLFLV